MNGRSRIGLTALLTACATAPGPSPIDPSRGPLLGPVTSVTPTTTGTIACSQAGVVLLDAAGTTTRRFDPDFRPLACAVDPQDGGWFVVGGVPGESGSVARVDAAGNTAPVVLARDMIACIVVTPTGDVVCGCDDGRVLALDRTTRNSPTELRRHTAPVRALAWSNGLLASAALDGNVLLGPVDGAPTVLRDHTAGIECAAWSFDGSILASGSRDGRVRFHARDGGLLGSTPPLRTRVLTLVALPDGRFACGDADGRVRVVTPPPELSLAVVGEVGEPIFALTRAGDGSLLAGTRGRIIAVAR